MSGFTYFRRLIDASLPCMFTLASSFPGIVTLHLTAVVQQAVALHTGADPALAAAAARRHSRVSRGVGRRDVHHRWTRRQVIDVTTSARQRSGESARGRRDRRTTHRRIPCRRDHLPRGRPRHRPSGYHHRRPVGAGRRHLPGGRLGEHQHPQRDPAPPAGPPRPARGRPGVGQHRRQSRSPRSSSTIARPVGEWTKTSRSTATWCRPAMGRMTKIPAPNLTVQYCISSEALNARQPRVRRHLGRRGCHVPPQPVRL